MTSPWLAGLETGTKKLGGGDPKAEAAGDVGIDPTIDGANPGVA